MKAVINLFIKSGGMRMKKGLGIVLLSGLLGIFVSTAWAGGIDNKQNFSAAYVASPSRNAATEGADVAAYNPAGIMQMGNGGYLEIDGQVITLDYDHRINGRDYGISNTALPPTAFGIYKSDQWAFFGTFTINGGGGEVEYKEGNSITQGIATAGLAGGFSDPALNAHAASTGTPRPNGNYLNPGGIFANQYAYSESFHYTFTAGTAYAVNEAFSVAAAIRYITTKKEVDIHGDYTQGGTTQDVLGKYEQDAQGWGGVISMNYRMNDRLNLAAKYETKVELDWYTEVDEASRGTVGENILWMNGRVHGKEYARDLPAVFATGLEWKVLDKLTVAPSFTYYFEKDADMDTQNAKVDKNSYDIALGLRYDFNETWTAMTGYMYTDVGIKPEDFGIIEKMNPALDCHTFSLGCRYRMNEKWTFTTGVMASLYVSDTAPASGPNPKTTYEKDVMTYAIGVQYKFL